MNETKQGEQHIEALVAALVAADNLRKAVGRGAVSKLHLDAYDRARAEVDQSAAALASAEATS